jgi:hypothetical protein
MPSIDARITKVEQDPETGWARVHTDDERIKTLDTKRPDLIAEAGQLRVAGVPCRIEFSEKDSRNVNPHSGKPYTNRYYEGAVALGEKPEPQGIDMVTPTGRKTDPGDAWRICLAAGGKLAVATLPMMPTSQRSFEVQKQIALAWAEFFYFTAAPERPSLNGNPGSHFQAPADAGATRNPGAYGEPEYAGLAGSDDDIPF